MEIFGLVIVVCLLCLCLLYLCLLYLCLLYLCLLSWPCLVNFVPDQCLCGLPSSPRDGFALDYARFAVTLLTHHNCLHDTCHHFTRRSATRSPSSEAFT